MEKFLKVNIKKQPNLRYKVLYGGCIMIRAVPNHGSSEDIIYWFSFNKTKEMEKTWSDYEYFVDDEGDVSRRPRNAC